MSMFNDISWRSQDNEQECESNAELVSIYARRFHQEDGHSSDLDQNRSGVLLTLIDHKENGTESLNWCWSNSEKADTPVFRATSPLSRGTVKSKGCGKLSIHFCADGDTIETVFRTINSVNQLSIYGAVLDLCEEYSSCQVRTGWLVLAEQSDPLFVQQTCW